MLVAELVKGFLESPQFLRLKPGSQRNYRYWLFLGVELLGNRPVERIRYAQADKLLIEARQELGDHRAVSICRVLRRVWTVGIRQEAVKLNPFRGMGLPTLDDREVVWTADEVADCVICCDDSGFPSLGTLVLLCYDLCQRPGDMRQSKWVNYTGLRLDYVQEKTGKRMYSAVPPVLQDRLDSIERIGPYIVTSERTGTMYTERDYNKLFFDIKRRAHLRMELELRDLRRTGLTEAGENDASDAELQALGGHHNRNQLNTYQRGSYRLSLKAMAKRFPMEREE